MTSWHAFLLGLVQGITEFLPISSSGHLALGQYFLGMENLHNFILFDLICHLGTLFAIIYTFLPYIKESLSTRNDQFWQVILATLPLFPLVLLMKPIKSMFDQPQILGPCFLVTAFLLFASVYLPVSWPYQSQRKWKDALTIGLFQAVAILPGISRSGATISAARLLGWQKEKAVRFSFLLAIPAILGGTILEVWQVWNAPASSISMIYPSAFIIGFFTSFAFGCFSLWILIRLVLQDKWSCFAWYCLIVGLFTTYYFNFL